MRIHRPAHGGPVPSSIQVRIGRLVPPHSSQARNQSGHRRRQTGRYPLRNGQTPHPLRVRPSRQSRAKPRKKRTLSAPPGLRTRFQIDPAGSGRFIRVNELISASSTEPPKIAASTNRADLWSLGKREAGSRGSNPPKCIVDPPQGSRNPAQHEPLQICAVHGPDQWTRGCRQFEHEPLNHPAIADFSTLFA